MTDLSQAGVGSLAEKRTIEDVAAEVRALPKGRLIIDGSFVEITPAKLECVISDLLMFSKGVPPIAFDTQADFIVFVRCSVMNSSQEFDALP